MIEPRAIALQLIKNAFPEFPVFFGFDYIEELQKCMQSGKRFIFADHAYFDRGYDAGNFRVIDSAIHQTKLKKFDKPKNFELKKNEWKKDGNHVLVFPPSKTIARTLDSGCWTLDTVDALKKHTDRQIIIKPKDKGDLAKMLRTAHAVVGYASVASVESVMAGVPAFCGPHCPATPVGLQDLSQIESPSYGDKYQWFTSLTWSQFSRKEIESGLCRETILGA